MATHAGSTDPSVHAATPQQAEALLAGVFARAQTSGVFSDVKLAGGQLSCAAKGPESEAFYRLAFEGQRLWISLVTPDRYLSQSIEQDLVHRGDKIGELLNEEMLDLGLINTRNAPLPIVEHFRDNAKLYTFRTPIEHVLTLGNAAPDAAIKWLLAYEATFRELGGMVGSDE